MAIKLLVLRLSNCSYYLHYSAKFRKSRDVLRVFFALWHCIIRFSFSGMITFAKPAAYFAMSDQVRIQEFVRGGQLLRPNVADIAKWSSVSGASH